MHSDIARDYGAAESGYPRGAHVVRPWIPAFAGMTGLPLQEALRRRQQRA
jgi:hypothetical protein